MDAHFFRLCGISFEDVDYILDTFPVVRRKDEAKDGTYRIKDLILAEYDRMATADLNVETPLVEGGNCTSTLTLPLGHGSDTPPDRRRLPHASRSPQLREATSGARNGQRDTADQ
ncbi:hypothetical protein [Streptomyces heilongjiangensis]|uniref:Uncharacterized protein n=1 Tax=Streptomyces heilongjiangensis TaxID=945052 RepID=A0ABW1B3U6_9ACTN|nr:hypothetical protein [Streptomyces heilongjiangensis]MDC2946935.1 hypothetical protein [Streptomyces heilongjiangensis]